MSKKSELITFGGSELIEVLSEIEYILISLRDIGSYYYQRVCAPPDERTPIAFALEITRFLDDNKINDRLEKMKNTLSEQLIYETGAEDLHILKRLLENIKCWEQPGD